MFTSLPPELRTLSYSVVQEDTAIAVKYETPLDTAVLEAISKPLPLSIPDSLTSYGLIKEASDLDRFLDHVLTAYCTTASAAPPEYTPSIAASRPSECEICGREHLPLTYHHLIPREAHAKAVKRKWIHGPSPASTRHVLTYIGGWHPEWALNKVAWLCRACHSYVHRIASNEELAKELYSIDLLLEREDVQKWAVWVSKVRWKKT